jgi:hypothetical protein
VSALSPRGTWYAGNDATGLVRGDPLGRSSPEHSPPFPSYVAFAAVNEAGDVAAVVGNRVFAWPRRAAPRELGDHPIGLPIAGIDIRADGTPVTWNANRIIVWSRPPRTLELPDGVLLQLDPGLALDEAGDRALVRCTRNGASRRCLVELASGRIDALEHSTADIGALSADGTHAVTASDTGGYLWWSTATRTAVPFAGPRVPELAALSRDGRIAVVGSSGDAALVDLERGTSIAVRNHRIHTPIAFAPDARTLVDRDGALVDVATGELRTALTGRYVAHAFRDDTAILATAHGIIPLPDDLPREPAELSAWIRARIPPTSR